MKVYTKDEREYYDKMREHLLEQLKNMSKQEKINYLNERDFYNQMIDRWSREEYIYDDLVYDLLKEVENDEI